MTRPPYRQLLADIETMSILAVGRKYGVSDSAVRKWLRWYQYQQELGEYRRERDNRAA